ncbi:MAG TPA: hypothetical protein VF682_00520 [Pseudomonas sp.]|jgi:hypothetical protein
MTISQPTPNSLELRPSQESIDAWVRGALLQRANLLLSTDNASAKAALASYGIPKFVDEFTIYAKSYGWYITPQDRPYLIHMAGQLPN